MDSSQTQAYYGAALATLRYMEQRQATGRRFGAEADARWSSFRGDLTTADRIDLLIRDADAQWPSAFGARTVFGMPAVAEDEPFGGDWEPLDAVDAEEMWRSLLAADAPSSLKDALGAAAKAWELSISAFDPGMVQAAEKLLVVGPSAICATIGAFAEGSDLDWSDQVTVVATTPAHRQLGALGSALLGATKRARVWAAEHATAQPGARLVVSEDADAADAAKARELVSA